MAKKMVELVVGDSCDDEIKIELEEDWEPPFELEEGYEIIGDVLEELRPYEQARMILSGRIKEISEQCGHNRLKAGFDLCAECEQAKKNVSKLKFYVLQKLFADDSPLKDAECMCIVKGWKVAKAKAELAVDSNISVLRITDVTEDDPVYKAIAKFFKHAGL